MDQKVIMKKSVRTVWFLLVLSMINSFILTGCFVFGGVASSDSSNGEKSGEGTEVISHTENRDSQYEPDMGYMAEGNYKEASKETLPRNEYAAIEFEYRKQYWKYDEMNPEQQELIKRYVNAATAGDCAAVASYSPEFVATFNTREVYWSELYTIYNGCRVGIHVGGPDSECWCQVRPENGLGYMCQVNNGFTDDYKNTDYVNGKCNCSAYQWNGTAEVESYFENQYSLDEGHEIGEMLNSERMGTWTREVYYNDKENGFDGKYVERLEYEHKKLTVFEENSQVEPFVFNSFSSLTGFFAGDDDIWF